MADAELLSTSVRRKLERLRWAIRAHVACRGLAWVAAAVLAAVLVSLLCDWGLARLTHLPAGRGQRAAVSAACLAGVALAAWRHLRIPLSRPIGMSDVAAIVERHYGCLGGRLIAAVQLEAAAERADPLADAMIRRTAAQANALAAELDFLAPLDRRRLASHLAGVLAAGALLAGLSLAAPQTMRLWLARNVLLRDVPWPQDTYLVVEGGPSLAGVRGQDLAVVVSVRPDSAVVPESATFSVASASLGRAVEPVALEASGGRPRYTMVFPRLAEPLTFRVAAGDARTGECRVRLVEAAQLAAAEFLVEPPEYTRLGPRRADATELPLSIPAGSWLTVRAAATKPLSAARLMLDGRAVGPASVQPVQLAGRESAPGVVGRFQLEAPPAGSAAAVLRLDLTDADGFTTREAASFPIQVVGDVPPELDVDWGAAGGNITPRAVIPVDVEARDGYGVARLEAIASWGDGAAALPIAAPDAPKRRVQAKGHGIDLAPLGLRAGQTLRLALRAQDALPAGAGGPGQCVSAGREFRVVTEQALLGELLASRQELRRRMLEAAAAQAAARDAIEAAAQAARAGQAAQAAEFAERSARDQQQALSLAACGLNTAAQVLRTLTDNRAGLPGDRRRLDERVVQPLTRLTWQDMPAALAQIEGRPRPEPPGGAEDLARLGAMQDEFRRQLEAAAEQAARLEGTADLARILGEIIDASEDVQKDIHRQLEAQAEDVFDP